MSDSFITVGVWSSEEDAGRDLAEVIAEIIDSIAAAQGTPATVPSSREVVVDWRVGGAAGRSVFPTGPSLGQALVQTMRATGVYGYASAPVGRGAAELRDGGDLRRDPETGRFLRSGSITGDWSLVIYTAEDSDDVPEGDDAPF